MLRFALMLSLVLLTVAGIAAAGVWAALVALGAISASAGVRGLALVILVAGAGCLVLIVRTTRRRFAPIAALIGAAEQIERGDYSARVPERGGRDVRALARTFNTMSERLSAVDSRQRRSFLADVAHELRTPLAIMRGRLEAMLDGIHPRDDDHLRAVLGHAAALERLVGDVATVAAAEAGALPLNLQQIDLAVLSNNVADDFAETARQTGADIRVQVDSNAATVSGDAARLRQALAEPRRKCAPLGRCGRRDRRRPHCGRHRDLGARQRRRHRPGAPTTSSTASCGARSPRAAGSVWRSWPISLRRTEAAAAASTHGVG